MGVNPLGLPRLTCCVVQFDVLRGLSCSALEGCADTSELGLQPSRYFPDGWKLRGVILQ